MFSESYYIGVVKHLTLLNGLNVFDLQLDVSIPFECAPQCRVYCGMCIKCFECVDVDSCTFDGKCHHCGLCDDD